MQTRYLTLAYGDSADVYTQSAMLLISLLAHAPAASELIVATGRPERFAWFGNTVRLVTLNQRELEVWRGTPPISMRVKLEAIRANWPGNGAIVLLDADVLAREPLGSFEAALSTGEVFMHKQEYELGRSTRRGNRAAADTGGRRLLCAQAEAFRFLFHLARCAPFISRCAQADHHRFCHGHLRALHRERCLHARL